MSQSRPILNWIHALTFELMLGLAGLLLAKWCLDTPLWMRWEWNAKAWLWGAIGTIPPVIMLTLITALPFQSLREFRQLIDQHVVPLFRNLTWWQLGLISFSAGWGEELLFRGFLQPLLAQWNLPTALILTSLLFAALHALSKLYFALAFLISMYLGWVLHVTENIAIPIMIHAIYDFIALLWILKLNQDQDLHSDDSRL
jgi:uncharacterized protein